MFNISYDILNSIRNYLEIPNEERKQIIINIVSEFYSINLNFL